MKTLWLVPLLFALLVHTRDYSAGATRPTEIPFAVGEQLVHDSLS
jgi:hypothetical protein